LALGNLAQRFLVAVIAAPILLVVLYLGRPEPAWALIFLASLIAMHEFFAMTLPKEDRVPSIALGAVACIALYWVDAHALVKLGMGERKALALGFSGPTVAILFAVVAPGLYYLFRFRDIPSVAGRYTAPLAGIVYAGFLTTFLAMFKRNWPDTNEGGHLVVLVLLIAWIADTGAYFAGRFLGKTKLYEAVSPKKTWAGAWGGLAGSLTSIILMKLLFLDRLSWVDVFLIGIPAGVLGQLGDLTESLIKRSTGVKDSGSLLPGHGGILDRIDAVLFIAPYVYAYLTLKAAL
jgi:phosphatidate cytidylyltransferase